MANLHTVVHKITEKFEELDTDKDGKISKDEFKALKLPGVKDKDRDALFEEAANITKDQGGKETHITKGDLKAHEYNPTEKAYLDAASRMSKLFGVEVFIGPVRDFNGVPVFKVKAGEDKASAEKVIDKLIEARKKAGLVKDDLPFSSDAEGNVVIDARYIFKYAAGGNPLVPGAAPKLIEKAFDALEKPANKNAVQEIFRPKA